MRIAVIGTGLMGAALAEVLLKSGHDVVVYNRTPAKLIPLIALGAFAAETPGEAIAQADATFLVLTDAACMEQVLLSDETRPALAGSRLINVATVSPDEVEALGRSVAEHGGDLAELTVLAYPDHVRARTGHYIIGCGEAIAGFWQDIVAPLGLSAHRIGVLGDAARGDLAFAATFVFNITAAAFTAAMATKLKVPSEVILRQLSDNPAIAVTGAAELLPQMFAGTYLESLASVDTVAMALDMALPQARLLGIPTKILEGFQELYAEASRRGLGSKDVASIYEVLMKPSSDQSERTGDDGCVLAVAGRAQMFS